MSDASRDVKEKGQLDSQESERPTASSTEKSLVEGEANQNCCHAEYSRNDDYSCPIQNK